MLGLKRNEEQLHEDCPMTSQDATQHESDDRHWPEPENETEPRPMPQATSDGQLKLGATATPMPHRSPREHKKADRKLKHNKGPKKSINLKQIQVCFVSSSCGHGT